MKEKVIVHCPQIPTGTAGTKGFGKTCAVYVLRVGDGFRDMRSRGKFRVLAHLGWVRMDYGTKRGNAARVLGKARDMVAMFTPGERTTREEF
jgi:hypothetical protein